MAVIPNDEKIMVIDNEVQAKYTGSPLLQERQRYYTIQDFKDTMGGGGGAGLGGLKIIADGSVGGPIIFPASISLFLPANEPGEFVAEVKAAISLSLGGGGYGGAPFNASTVVLPEATEFNDLSIQNTTSLVTFSAPELKEVFGWTFSFTGNQALETLNFPKLETARNIYFGNTPNLTSVNFSELQVVTGAIGINMPNTGIQVFKEETFPSLREVNTINYGWSFIQGLEVDLPLVTKINGLDGGASSSGITKINLPGLVQIPGFISVQNASNLTQLTLGTVGVTKSWSNYVNLYTEGCALNQASVDNILLVLLSLDGTNGTTSIQGGFVSLNGGTNSAPSPAGLAAANTLLTRGLYISLNS